MHRALAWHMHNLLSTMIINHSCVPHRLSLRTWLRNRSAVPVWSTLTYASTIRKQPTTDPITYVTSKASSSLWEIRWGLCCMSRSLQTLHDDYFHRFTAGQCDLNTVSRWKMHWKCMWTQFQWLVWYRKRVRTVLQKMLAQTAYKYLRHIWT